MLVAEILVVISMTISLTRSQTNLALGKPAYQSGQSYDYSAEKAVDGYFKTKLIGRQGCTHTEDDLSTPTPWWTVDLQGFYHITNVTITNRASPCCSGRLNDFKVMVGKEFSPTKTGISEISTWKQCVHVPGRLGDGETRNIRCSEIHSGRFLSIYLDHDGILTLCEVQVLGYQYNYSRIYEKMTKNTKVRRGILGEHYVKAETECVLHCVLHYTCTVFSHYGDALINNCLLGSATSSEETEDGWTTFFI